jgi:hypothetical protein
MAFIPGVSGKTAAILTTALLFIVVSHPVTYGLVNALLSPIVGPIATPSGAPTTVGIVVHSLVFAYAQKYLL